jgi:tetrahydromethanopterin S-methyltransferase subunit G
MASDVTRSEFDHLASRVSVVEREVEGEKMVTRHVLEQSRRNGDDLTALKTRLDRIENRLEGHDNRFDGLERKVDRLAGEMAGLRAELPTMIGDVMREVLHERDTKR